MQVSPTVVRAILAAAFAVAAALGVLHANRSWLLPGASSDSVQYLEAAESFERDGTLTVPIAPWAATDSMTAGVRIVAGMVAVAATVATAATSRIPVTFHAEDEAMLRLAWRIQGATLESCRQPTEEELAELPVHMRNPQACIGQVAPYVLSVRIDGRVLAQDTVYAPGARGDRPLSVLQDHPLAAGTHRLDVSFDAILPEGAEVTDRSVVHLRWGGEVTLGAREVALVTLNLAGSALELRMP